MYVFQSGLGWDRDGGRRGGKEKKDWHFFSRISASAGKKEQIHFPNEK